MKDILLITVILNVVVIIGAIVFLICMLYKNKKRDKELMRRLPEVEYTEIISSTNGNNGIISTFNTNGGVGFGSYSSCPTTKFLVVYKSGYKQIVNLRDSKPLFNEYVRLLKNK